MNTILISYDLGLPEAISDYKLLISYITNYPFWAKLLKSVWLIKTDKNTSEVRDEINRIIDSNDKLVVICLNQKSWATYNLPREVTDWMKRNI